MYYIRELRKYRLELVEENMEQGWKKSSIASKLLANKKKQEEIYIKNASKEKYSRILKDTGGNTDAIIQHISQFK